MRVRGWSVARRCTQVLVLLLLVTPALGWSVFEGTLASASLLGLKLSDPLATLQVLLLTGSLAMPLLVGCVSVLAFYWCLGGRSFCGWVCPVHLLTDLVDLIPGRQRLRRWGNGWKWSALLVVVALTLITGLPVFETVSPIGIGVRALSFGPGTGLLLLGLIVLAELLLVRRLWCRSLCPLGAVYVGLGHCSPLKVVYRREACTHCGRCQQVCFVPEVLDAPLQAGAGAVDSGECSRCAACIAHCPTHALKFGFRKP